MSSDPVPSGHEKEPWRIEYGIVLNQLCEDVPVLLSGDVVIGEIDSKANAERIVACVNACKGINPATMMDLLVTCKKIRESLYKEGYCSGCYRNKRPNSSHMKCFDCQ